MKYKNVGKFFFVFCLAISLTNCGSIEYDEFTGSWESDYSKYKIIKESGEYSYTISDKDGKYAVTYFGGKFNKKTATVNFKYAKNNWQDSFKYDKKTKKLKLTDIRKKGNVKIFLTKLKAGKNSAKK